MRASGHGTGASGGSGFTLVELMIVIAIIAVLAGIALPKLMRSRVNANESAAISTLRSIASAQSQVQAMSAIDSDADGAGEFAFLGELAGSAPLRISVGALPALGVDTLNPSVVSLSFGNIQADALGEGVVTRSGYVFKMFLPGVTAGGLTPAIPEDPAGGATVGSLPNPNNCEILWSCYAWPVDANRSGNRVFFLNQESELMQYQNRDGAYNGLVTPATIPSFDAALSAVVGPDHMGAPLALNGTPANDGNDWTGVQ